MRKAGGRARMGRFSKLARYVADEYLVAVSTYHSSVAGEVSYRTLAEVKLLLKAPNDLVVFSLSKTWKAVGEGTAVSL